MSARLRLKSALISSAAEREQLNVRELALAVLWNLTGILADADAGRRSVVARNVGHGRARRASHNHAHLSGYRQRASHQQYTSTVYDRGLSARIAVRVKALQSGEQVRRARTPRAGASARALTLINFPPGEP